MTIGPRWTITQDYRGTPTNLPAGMTDPPLLIQAESAGLHSPGVDNVTPTDAYHRQRIVSDGVELVNRVTPRAYQLSVISPSKTKIKLGWNAYNSSHLTFVGYNTLMSFHQLASLRNALVGKTISCDYFPEGTTITDVFADPFASYDYQWVVIETSLGTGLGSYLPYLGYNLDFDVDLGSTSYSVVYNDCFDTYGNLPLPGQSDPVTEFTNALFLASAFHNSLLLLTTFDEPTNHMVSSYSWTYLEASYRSNINKYNRTYRDMHMLLGHFNQKPIYEDHRSGEPNPNVVTCDYPITFTGWLA